MLMATMGRRAALAVALLLVCSLTEGIGLLLLVPLLQAVGLQVGQGGLGRISATLAHLFSIVGLQPTLVTVLAFYVGITAAQALLVRWQNVANARLCYEFAARLRGRLYHAIAGANWLFLSGSRSSALTHALTGEIDRVGTGTYHLVSLVATTAVTGVYVLVALRVSVPITLLVFACGGVLLLAVSRKNAAARAEGERASDRTRHVYGLAIEHLASMKTTRSYGAEERSSALFSRGVEDVADAYLGSVRLQADSRAWFEVGSVVILASLVLLTIQVQNLPAAAVFLLLFLFARIMPRVAAIQQNAQQYVNLLPSFVAVVALWRECDAAAECTGAAVTVPSPPLERAIRFDGVSFHYGTIDDGFGIDALDMEILAGATTAIIGPSGSGKSTVADLVIGLLAPRSGRVLIDGTALRPDMLRSWRERIGYVPQDTFLFHDTVRANLAWANPVATEAAMREALRLAAADEIVTALPRGLDTVLGDRGMRLSGGERQRIALARALLRKPRLLILDEATSALDGENERRILDAIGSLHGALAILIITHRLASVRGADMIYVLEQGHLTEAGSWDTLTAAPESRFRALCLAQGIAFDERAPAARAV